MGLPINRIAVEVLLEKLEELGRLSAGVGPLVALARSLGDSVDENPKHAGLWREYRLAIDSLRELFESDDVTFTQIVAGLRAEVPDSSD